MRVSVSVLKSLMGSEEPSVHWKVRVHVLGEDPDSLAIRRLRNTIRRSVRVRQILDGHAALAPIRSYAKWRGGHWVLLTLADLGYPEGDETLAPIRDEMLATWLSKPYYKDVVRGDSRPGGPGVPVINGRHRRCGSQQGAALLSTVRLGIDDGRGHDLVERLQHWQWPDGGWNCDVRPEAATSSVHETLLPMRGLVAYAHENDTKDTTARRAARDAAEVLLTRAVVFRRSTGELVHKDWAALHYPPYWHYDLLAGLKGLAEAGLLSDPRCDRALDLLESQQLPDGGWPAGGRYYKGVGGNGPARDHVDWGPVDRRRSNEWVTADALAVLVAAGRWPSGA